MLRFIAVFLLVSITLSGCANPPVVQSVKASELPTASVPQDLTQRDHHDLEAIRQKGVLVVGTSISPPFESYDPETNQLIGFDVDIAQYIADRLGVRLEWAEIPFAALIPSLSSGKVDMTIAAMYITPEREALVRFTEPYIETGLVIVTRPEEAERIQNLEDLQSKRVGVKIGATGAKLAEELAAQGISLEIREYKDTLASLLDLEVGRVDLVLNDYLNTLAYRRENRTDLEIVTTPDGSEYFLSKAGLGIAVQRENTSLLNELNVILGEMQSDGTYDRLVEKWLKK